MLLQDRTFQILIRALEFLVNVLLAINYKTKRDNKKLNETINEYNQV